MREYFRPRRRKLGVLTLVMACACCCAWVNSFVFIGDFSVTGGWPEVFVISRAGFVAIEIQTVLNARSQSTKTTWNLQPYSELEAFRTMTGFDISFAISSASYSFLGIRYATLSEDYGNWVMLDLPYWSMALPLTAVSAWLLLSRRCESKSTRHFISNSQHESEASGITSVQYGLATSGSH